MLLELSIEDYAPKLKTRKLEGKTYLWCLIRQKWLVLQPEEFVRQLLLHYFIEVLKVNQSRIAVERGLKVNGMQKRCDILIFDKELQPWMLVECKAPSVKLNQKVFRQIANYNMPLQVPLLLVSNGPQAYCSLINFEESSFTFLDHLDVYPA